MYIFLLKSFTCKCSSLAVKVKKVRNCSETFRTKIHQKLLNTYYYGLSWILHKKIHLIITTRLRQETAEVLAYGLLGALKGDLVLETSSIPIGTLTSNLPILMKSLDSLNYSPPPPSPLPQFSITPPLFV